MTAVEALRRPATALALVGLAIATGVVLWTGAPQVWRAFAAVGLPGFLLLCLFTLAYQALLGGAWAALDRRPLARLPLFVWARLVREGVNEALPLTPLGGLVAGGRVLAVAGVPGRRASALAVVDMSIEFFAEIAFLAVGAVLAFETLADGGADRAGPLFALALGGAAAAGAGLLLVPGPALATIERFCARLLPTLATSAGSLRREIETISQRRAGLLAGFLLHFLSWLLSAGWAAAALSLIGNPIGLPAAVAIEALICAVRTAAFVVPNGVGVQEGAYALLGPLFGLPPEAAVALSLLKRGRDLALGAPTVVFWQLQEARRLRRTPHRSPA
jgi:putative membrane protein